MVRWIAYIPDVERKAKEDQGRPRKIKEGQGRSRKTKKTKKIRRSEDQKIRKIEEDQ